MRIDFVLTLASDAEPGTGLGSGLVDDFVPRGHDGLPVLRGTHLRGLLRDRLRDIGHKLKRPGLDDELLGREGAALTDEGLVSVGDARAIEEQDPLFVARTALDEHGTARSGSLRNREAVAVGTRFQGYLQVRAEASAFAVDCLRLSLLSIQAVGGGRTRGAGTCFIDIEGDHRSPGKVFLELVSRTDKSARSPRTDTATTKTSDALHLLRLEFIAESPVCCPDIPVLSAINVIRSGIAIPASAVQGAVLHRLDRLAPDLAKRCFEDPQFRAWPLLPSGTQHAEGIPIRAPITHRVDKRAVSGDLETCDVFDVSQASSVSAAADGFAYKTSDGVMLVDAAGEVTLWKSNSIPRVVTAHAVHHASEGKQVNNLFTVDALAPLCFSGLLGIPEYAQELLLESLKSDPMVFFGKGRGVRGGGKLSATPIPTHADVHELRADPARPTVLVVQSPVVLPSTADDVHAPLQKQALEFFSTWCRKHGLPTPSGFWGVGGVRFGWNRHQQQGRTPARRVLLPGATLALETASDPEALRRALLAGAGEGRQEGYGALAVHPGIATRLWHGKTTTLSISTPGAAALEHVERMSRLNLPSPSQLSALLGHLEGEGPEAAARFLSDQAKKRPTRIYKMWLPALDDLQELIKKEHAGPALKTLIDLAVRKEVRA
jgi:hypothetical protein